jgi:hypothetical protein
MSLLATAPSTSNPVIKDKIPSSIRFAHLSFEENIDEIRFHLSMGPMDATKAVAEPEVCRDGVYLEVPLIVDWRKQLDPSSVFWKVYPMYMMMDGKRFDFVGTRVNTRSVWYRHIP